MTDQYWANCLSTSGFEVKPKLSERCAHEASLTLPVSVSLLSVVISAYRLNVSNMNKNPIRGQKK